MDKNTLQQINDLVPEYFSLIAQKYSMHFFKLDELNTALIGKTFAIIFYIDREGIVLYYVYRELDGTLTKCECDNYWILLMNDQDREGIGPANEVKQQLENELKIYVKAFANTLNFVLTEDKEWLKKYQKSIWYTKYALTPNEKQILDPLLK